MSKEDSSSWSSVKPSIFKGYNYDFWSIKMKTLLISLDMWEMVEVEYEELEDIDNIPKQNSKIWKQREVEML